MAALWDDFHAAVRVLVGIGPIKQRLIDAYRNHLSMLREHDLPGPLQARFAALRSAMHEAPATGGLTAPEASVRKMSEKNAADHATAILGMFLVLSGENEGAPRLRIVSTDNPAASTDDPDGVPTFLNRA